MTYDVCASSEVPAGAMVARAAGESPVVVVRTPAGELHAFVDRCLHQGAPLSRGRLLAAVDGERPGEYRALGERVVIKCPWHGYEYEVASGCVLFDRRRRLRRLTVSEAGGRVLIDLAEGAAR